MSGITHFFLKFLILAAMLLGLPLGGVYWTGYPVSRYLEFPPKTQYVDHEPFSWIAFAFHAFLISAFLAPLIISAYQSRKELETRTRPSRPFPWWGWLGLVLGAMAWVMAWTRFEWFAGLQPHTFTPLWLSFILVINGLCFRHNGHCMMLDRPLYFLLLFPVSSAFWWFFEYLNRFVQNWHYIGPEFSSWEYFWYATLPFSTVLPAVLGIRDWILSTHWLRKKFRNFRSIGYCTSESPCGSDSGSIRSGPGRHRRLAKHPLSVGLGITVIDYHILTNLDGTRVIFFASYRPEIGPGSLLLPWPQSSAGCSGRCGIISAWPNGNTAYLLSTDIRFLKCRFWGMQDIFPLAWNVRFSAAC